MQLLAIAAERHEIEVLGWCLMPNHFHLVLHTPKRNLSAAMHVLGSVTARRYNEAYDRVGHLYQGRFHNVVLDNETQIASALVYVALNPVKASLCETAEDWDWSSHRAILNPSLRPNFLTVGWIEASFGSVERFDEVVRAQAERRRPALIELLPPVDPIVMAYEEHGYSVDEIASYLRLHPASVRRRIRVSKSETNVPGTK